MRKQLVVMLICILAGTLAAQAQTNDPVLFSVDGTPVTVSEFKYIYSKTNGKDADFSEKSLEDYMDLYVKFKLKVKRARDMQVDTIPTLRDELQGYRRQLADSYLVDKTVTESLIKEAYERMTQDVDVSHLVAGIKGDQPADTLAAYEKILAAKRRIEGGEDFVAVAKEVSDDNSAKNNGGRIGFVTAMFPTGFYALETAAYKAPLGKLYGPVRTTAGYHLLIAHARRPARGEVEVAHLIIRKKPGAEAAAKVTIDSIYKALQAGADFDEAVRLYTQDNATKANNGYIGFFGINRYERVFEDAAFGIAQDGGFSAPVETASGWHIIKRISKPGVQPYTIEKGRLDSKVRRDPRFDEARREMLASIKRDNDFKEYPQVLDQFVGALTDTFVTFRWKAPEKPSTEPLFTLGSAYKATLGDFTDFLSRASRQRMSMRNADTPESVARQLYATFVEDNLMQFEETQLEKKYPEFKSLMREYEEGILLFEATKMLIWDKASQDSVGLEAFAEKIKGKYRWSDRARTTVFSVQPKYMAEAKVIWEYAKKNSAAEVMAKYNRDSITRVAVEEVLMEKGRNVELEGMDWKVGAVSKLGASKVNQPVKFVKIEETIPSSNKTLNEARGYIIADYQDELERQWVASLRKDYEVKINKEALKGLVKK